MLQDGMQTTHGNALNSVSAPPMPPGRTSTNRGRQNSITPTALKVLCLAESVTRHHPKLPSTVLQAQPPPPKASARHHVNPEPSSLSSVQELLAAIESDLDKGGALDCWCATAEHVLLCILESSACVGWS